MATHKATLGKTVDGVVEYIYPKTTSDIVEYTEEMSVKEKLDELSDKAGIAYGTCSTAAATVAKVVTCEGFELSTGASIHVCFTNANSATAPTMNVNGTGAYPITWYGTTEAGTSTWRAGAVESFTYDGTSWVMSNASTADTTYYGQTKLSDSISSTSTSLAATANAVKTAYDAATAAQESADEAQAAAEEAMEAAEQNVYVHPTVTADNSTSTASPEHGSSFTTIDSVTRDTCGHVTGVNTKTVTLPEGYVYEAGTGISISSTHVINHSNSVTAGTASGSATGSLSYGGTFTMPTVSYDAQGHITGSSTTTMTMPSVSDSTSSTSSSTAASSAAVKAAMDAAATAQAAAEAAQATADAAENTAEGISYSAGTGLSLSGTTFNHSNSVTAGTASGDSSKTLSYGGTFTIPSITYDAQGHITSTTTTTMTMPNATENTDTTYTAGTGLSLSGTTFNHSNSITAGTASGSATGTLSYGGTFTIPSITYDAQGHITSTTTTTMTMPAEITSVDTASKLGSSTVGSGTKPIYLSSGTATASSSTVGSGTVPMYLSSGTMTASTSTVGSGTIPMYLSSGTLTASTSTVGSDTKPMYLSSGTLTASSSTVGSSSAPVYLSSGTITACTGVATSSDLSSLSDTVSELSDEIDDLKNNSGSPEVITSLAGCNGFYMEGDLGTVTADNVDDFCNSYGLGSDTRKDVYIGCYFTASINGSNRVLRIASFDHDLNNYSEYGSQGKRHTVIVPDTYLDLDCVMNSSNTTEGAYVGSRMYTETIPIIDGYLQDVFGSHLVQFRNDLPDSVDTSMTNYNYPSFTGVVDDNSASCYYYSILMSEIEVYGKRYYSCDNGLYTCGYSIEHQLPLFWHNHKLIVIPSSSTANGGTFTPSTSTTDYWLRDVASSSDFCNVDFSGYPYCSGARYNLYVRPRFALM